MKSYAETIIKEGSHGGKNKMKKEINFIYHNRLPYEMVLEQKNTSPFLSKKFIPDWYKNMEPYLINEENPSGNNITVINRESNATAKKCMPMFDGMSSGYIIPLWSDVLISNANGSKDISWRVYPDVFQPHNESSRRIPPPIGYENTVFKYICWFRIKTPPGYSILITPPFGHYDLPFYAIPAIVDSDKSVIDSNFPCWIKSDLEGIVEKGTPIAQIIPFKRDNWKSNISLISFEDHMINEQKKFRSNIKNNYTRNIWSKKEFN
jgi:hypothetical protein